MLLLNSIMESLYHSTNRSLQEAQNQLSLASHAQVQEFPTLFRELQARLEQISRYDARSLHVNLDDIKLICLVIANVWTSWSIRNP